MFAACSRSLELDVLNLTLSQRQDVTHALAPDVCAGTPFTESAMSHTVDIPQELKTALRKFRFARRNAGHAAIVVKINKQKLIMEEVEQFDNISLEDLAEELPENAPRYVVLSYELAHDDGRKSFPLVS
ncbi:hypothetical protein BC629DRAFT_1587993 [Irpex lacteus]|nr:hypothetical protein BC629DRAFT_1587993 [Irpex lacteus]